MDGALASLFSALDSNGDGKLDPEEMCFLGKAVLGTMPTPEAAKKEIGKAAGDNAKTCTKDQFLKFASAGLGKCSDAGDAVETIKYFTERVKAAQKAAKAAAAAKGK
eukprot:g4822.t1